MQTFSLCMIVKNEANVLKRCLESYCGLMDEIIIVDTGSTDSTKDIAAEYTNLIYDFEWTGSFADARNFASSKATKDYIFTADADEYIDSENQKRLAVLKENILPEIEIVQMYYCTPSDVNTVYNFDKEYRPKLYKRLRCFTWIDPIHETLRLDPVVYDSEIEICHRPEGLHADRDLRALERLTNQGVRLSKKLHHMYAMELYHSGTGKDFLAAEDAFKLTLEQDDRSIDEMREAVCVLAKSRRMQGDMEGFFKYAMKDAALSFTAEACCELGAYYESIGDKSEAAVWYQNALSETESILDIRTSGEIPQAGLDRVMNNKAV